MKECREEIKRLIDVGLAEDIGPGDVTTEAIVSDDVGAVGTLVAKERGVLAGVEVAKEVFRALDSEAVWTAFMGDGEALEPGQIIARVEGKARAILSGERLALNILQRLSGIATMTSRYVAAVAHTKAVILDTRKTTPGMRCLEKYAVRQGGGSNHRRGLYDMVLIKGNHLKIAGGIASAVRRFEGTVGEVEVENLEEVREAMQLAVGRLMLDNMSAEEMREAVRLIRRGAGGVQIEASGGVTLDRVAKIAETGVDYISVGALTHSVEALDIALVIEAR